MKMHFFYLRPRNKIFLILFVMSVMFVNCSDDSSSTVKLGAPYDPNKPIVCESFLPDSGGVGTQLIIRGENFGIDTALVKVSVNGKTARVVGVNATRIYAVVPTRADTGIVKVMIGPRGEEKSFEFENEFYYLFKQNVSTLVGQSDNNGNSKFQDGTLAEAWLENIQGITIDDENVLYVAEENKGIRIINIGEDKVSSAMRVSGNLNRSRDVALTLNQDTLICVNDGDRNDAAIALFTLTRNNGFMNTKSFVNDWQCNTVAVNPVDGEIFYNSYTNGNVIRFDRETGKKELQFRIDESTEQAFAWSPDGKILYIATYGRHCIYKADYDFATKKLSDPVEFVGRKNSWGYQDGLGTDAYFDRPSGLVCDEFGFLYVADCNNHCIRQVTPDGVVTTFAGVPRTSGWGDGEPAKALFKNPQDITINRKDPSGAFYVVDRGNHRVRKIVVE